MIRNKQWLSHHRAHGLACTLAELEQWLMHDKALGYSGMTIVPKLWQVDGCTGITPRSVALAFKDAGMILQVCGFVTSEHDLGKGAGRDSAIGDLDDQFRFVEAAVRERVGRNQMVGPLDIAWKSHHRGFQKRNYSRWVNRLSRFADKWNTNLSIEFLNKKESPSPFPFEILREQIANHPNLDMHWDTGHAALLGLSQEDFDNSLPWIRYFEAANIGRKPLSDNSASETPIPYGEYFDKLGKLDDECMLGVEPFDPAKVINPLGLQDLCTTTIPGEKCLQLDAEFLKSAGVMKDSVIPSLKAAEEDGA